MNLSDLRQVSCGAPISPRRFRRFACRTQSGCANLIRAGNLYLTAQDAIALALENNIDIEVARYGPVFRNWQLERSQAGGALPGVPSSASQAGSVASGQGIAAVRLRQA